MAKHFGTSFEQLIQDRYFDGLESRSLPFAISNKLVGQIYAASNEKNETSRQATKLREIATKTTRFVFPANQAMPDVHRNETAIFWISSAGMGRSQKFVVETRDERGCPGENLAALSAFVIFPTLADSYSFRGSIKWQKVAADFSDSSASS